MPADLSLLAPSAHSHRVRSVTWLLLLFLVCSALRTQAQGGACPWTGGPLPPPVLHASAQELTGQWRLTGYEVHYALGLNAEDLAYVQAQYVYLDSAVQRMLLEFTPTGKIRQTVNPASTPQLVQERQFAVQSLGQLGAEVQVFNGCSQQPDRYHIQALGSHNLSFASVEQGGIVAVEFHWQRLPAQ